MSFKLDVFIDINCTLSIQLAFVRKEMFLCNFKFLKKKLTALLKMINLNMKTHHTLAEPFRYNPFNLNSIKILATPVT